MEKTNAMRILERGKAAYTVHAYEGGALSGVAVAQALGEDVGRVYKTLVTVGSPRKYYVFVIPVGAELDLKKAARAAGEKSVDMLPLKELFPLTGYVHGGCSPLGMKKQFPTIIHASAASYPKIYISGGRIGDTIALNPDDLLRTVRGQYADIIRRA